jgi:hypothetical protein
MSDQEKLKLYQNVKKHFGLIERIAGACQVKRQQVYRVLTGKSNNVDILLKSSELYRIEEQKKKQSYKEITQNQKLAESF